MVRLVSAKSALIFAILLALAVFLQWQGGAFTADFSADPDESAHYVTGLMVHDFLLHFPWPGPMAFAQDYYDHYPKVALGHWPPVFYMAEAAWGLVFSSGRWSMLVLNALFAALLALTLFEVLQRRTGAVLAAGAALVLLSLPLLQTYLQRVMPELLVALLMFWAALAFASFMRGGRTRPALLFGFLAMAAIMTKPNGIALALLPPIAIVLGWRWDLLRRPGLWLSGLPTLLVCVPWYWLTLDLIQRGYAAPNHAGNALLQFPLRNAGYLFAMLGALLSILAAIGVGARLLDRRQPGRPDPGVLCLAALLLATWIFISFIVPLGERRHLLPAAAPAVAFAALGLAAIAERLTAWYSRYPWLAGALMAVAAAGYLLEMGRIQHKTSSGAMAVAAEILSHPGLAANTILVASQGNGEGAIIAEVAMHRPQPRYRILRADQALADSDRPGGGYRLRYPTEDAVQGFLDHARVALLVLDTRLRPDKERDEQTPLLLRLVADRADLWHRVELPASAGPQQFAVYQRAGTR